MTRQRKSSSVDPSLGVLLKRAEQAMVRAKVALLKPVGLTLAQYVALTELEKQPGVTAAMLARACFVTPQAMMTVLKAMDQQGLAARLPHPRHANVLELRITDVGHERLRAARARVVPLERRVIGAYSNKEMDAFREFLTRFAEEFDASDRGTR